MPGHADGGSTAAVVEVEFSVADSTYPFVSATEGSDCVVELAEMMPRSGQRYAEIFNVTGAPPDQILDLTESYETLEIVLLREYDDGGLFEFVVSGDCPAFALAELGALPREAKAVDGEGRIVAEIPPRHDPPTVIAEFLDEAAHARFVSKRERDAVSPRFTQSALDQLVDAHLTERQREVVETAYEGGYYEWPRERSGEEIAETLDISSATFSEHVQAAERKLFAALLDRSE